MCTITWPYLLIVVTVNPVSVNDVGMIPLNTYYTMHCLNVDWTIMTRARNMNMYIPSCIYVSMYISKFNCKFDDHMNTFRIWVIICTPLLP